MKDYLQIFLFLVIILITGCKEEYFPEIDESETMLVVNGLLSDESSTIKVNLSNAAPFREYAYLPEKGAAVAVEDDLGNQIKLTEKSPGNYESKPVSFVYGRTYTLAIKTRKNNFYISTPQTLQPKAELDEVVHKVTTNTFETTINGEMVLKTFDGLGFSANLKTSSDASPYYLFKSTVLIEYNEKIHYAKTDSLTNDYHCWKKYHPDKNFNLNREGFNNLDEHVHDLSFTPIDSVFYGIIKEDIVTGYPPAVEYTYFRDLYYYVITIKKYHLNEDVYQYYKDINAQLEASNRIFDPVSFQVKGNMTCQNNPDEPVLGVFEVSSTSMRTYSFSEFLQDNTVIYREEQPLDMDEIYETGSVYEDYPAFWIFE
jgi:hypothetical protein